MVAAAKPNATPKKANIIKTSPMKTNSLKKSTKSLKLANSPLIKTPTKTFIKTPHPLKSKPTENKGQQKKKIDFNNSFEEIDSNPTKQKNKKTPGSIKLTPGETNNLLVEEKKRKINFNAALDTKEITNKKQKTAVKTPYPVKSIETSSVPEEKKRKLSFNVLNKETPDTTAETPTTSSTKKVSNAASPKQKKKNKKRRRQITGDNNANCIFIGNLPTSTKKEDILKLLSQHGKVLSLRLRCAQLTSKAKSRRAGAIKKDFVEGSTLNCFAIFENFEDAQEALKLNGHVYEEHHLRVDMQDPKGRQKYENKCAIFVSNMPRIGLRDDDLWEFFKDCGTVVSVRLLKTDNYENRGTGYINFQSPESVELALKLNGTNFKGRQIVINRIFNSSRQSKQKADEKDFKRDKKPQKKVDNTDFQGNKSQVKKKGKAPSLLVKKKKNIADILTKKNV